MAGTKRKSSGDAGDGSQKAKRTRSTEVSSTAAANRPRRSQGGASSAKPVATVVATKARSTAKDVAAKAKPKTGGKDATKGRKTKGKAGAAVQGDDLEQEAVPAPDAPKESAGPGKTKVSAKSKASTANGAKKKASTETEEQALGEARYWLMKAEPESRMEKGVDVRFSIHDLESRTKPEPWDGVRNPMAQKNMRNMSKGDLAFFYHSNCKIPGIAGLMQIVREHTIDESAFDEKHPYYDPKSSRDKPRWHVVHVEHLRTFDDLIPLRELQKHAKDGGPLAGMQVLRMSRLSVSQVSAEEWEYILRELAGINPKDVKAK